LRKKISYITHVVGFLSLLVIEGSFLLPAGQMAYAHNFSISESAQFLSLVEQIRAETALITMNLKNNNATLAYDHAENAASLLSNGTLNEVRERNNRIANTLESRLVQLEDNATSLTSTSQVQSPQDRIESINQTVQSLNDVLSEASTVRVDSEQRNNSTTWAMVLANLTNTVLSNYGIATGAPFDLTNMSNLAGMEAMETNHNLSSNMTTMNDDHQMQMADSGTSKEMMMAENTASISNMTTIVDAAAYQRAQYLANNTILHLFNDTLKPLTPRPNDTSGNNSATMAQEALDSLTTDTNNMTLKINELEASLLQLKDDINSRATPYEVMTTVHLKIHPFLIQLYGLTIEH
jgi:hypothetical protein